MHAGMLAQQLYMKENQPAWLTQYMVSCWSTRISYSVCDVCLYTCMCVCPVYNESGKSK